MLVSEIKEKSEQVISELKSLFGEHTRLLIAENTDPYSEENDYYIDPYSFIVDTGEPSPDKKLLNNFRDFLRATLEDISIEVLSWDFLDKATKHNVDDELAHDYKHLLDTAIDIKNLDSEKSWQDQFANQLKIIKEQQSEGRESPEPKRFKTDYKVDEKPPSPSSSPKPTYIGNSPLRKEEELIKFLGLLPEEFAQIPEDVRGKIFRNAIPKLELFNKNLASQSSSRSAE
jgi:hypothetical protein